jgi:hypothetical protein
MAVITEYHQKNADPGQEDLECADCLCFCGDGGAFLQYTFFSLILVAGNIAAFYVRSQCVLVYQEQHGSQHYPFHYIGVRDCNAVFQPLVSCSYLLKPDERPLKCADGAVIL